MSGHVNVIGKIWWPFGAVCAHSYSLSGYDVENIDQETPGQGISRADIQSWLDTHAGDFSEILDFEAVIGESVYGWRDDDSEWTYLGAMYGFEYDD